jgi:hypothetical protein
MAAVKYSREFQLIESMAVAIVAGSVSVIAAIALGRRLASFTSTNVGGIVSPIVALGIAVTPIFLTLYIRHKERATNMELKLRVEEEIEYELFNKIDLDLTSVVGEKMAA